MSDYFFCTSQLAVGYNGVPLIKDIEIRLNKGEILTLIGPNGSGKSTILKSIAKYLKNLYGAVYIGGAPLEGMSNRDLSYKMAVVLTEKPRTELMTCYDVVAAGRYPYTGRLGILTQADRAQVRQAMELVNAWALRGQDFIRVSDGQRQRVLLARAICQQPQIIVLDEPTSFLDVRYELELLGILRDMAERRGIAVIMSLHKLDMAQKISDSVMCVKGERITHYGPPQDIFKKELIHELYELEDGSYNPLFGSLEMGRPPGEPQVFVIAGGGSGIAEYRKLQRRRIPFVTGILHQNDIDWQLGCDLAAAVVSEKAFEPIGAAALREARQWLERCHTVVCALRDYGTMNEKNRQLYEIATARGLKIVHSSDAV